MKFVIFLISNFLHKSVYFTPFYLDFSLNIACDNSLINYFLKSNDQPLSGSNLSAKTNIYTISKYVSQIKIIVLTCIS